MSERESVLEVTDLVCGYGSTPVIRGVTFSLAAGRVVLLAGVNGAGKSTLMKTIAGFVQVRSGRITLCGSDLASYSVAQRVRRGVGVMLQSGQIFQSLSVRESLAFAARLLPSNGRRKRVDHCLATFGMLRDRLDQRAGLLSGGERQILSLCMAMIPNSRLLLLDEPISALASDLLGPVLRFIRSAAHEQGTAVLVVEQRVREVLAECDEAIALEKGGIVSASGTPRDWLDPRTSPLNYYLIT